MSEHSAVVLVEPSKIAAGDVRHGLARASHGVQIDLESCSNRAAVILRRAGVSPQEMRGVWWEYSQEENSFEGQLEKGTHRKISVTVPRTHEGRSIIQICDGQNTFLQIITMMEDEHQQLLSVKFEERGTGTRTLTATTSNGAGTKMELDGTLVRSVEDAWKRTGNVGVCSVVEAVANGGVSSIENLQLFFSPRQSMAHEMRKLSKTS